MWLHIQKITIFSQFNSDSTIEKIKSFGPPNDLKISMSYFLSNWLEIEDFHVVHGRSRKSSKIVGFSGNFHPKMTGKLKKCDSFFQNPCHFAPHGPLMGVRKSSKIRRFHDFKNFKVVTHLSSPTIAKMLLNLYVSSYSIIITWWRNVM